MTATIPNLWEGTITPTALTPLAILRTQAGYFNKQAKDVLRADVRSQHIPGDTEAEKAKRHTFVIEAFGAGYSREVLTAEHSATNSYPVRVYSTFFPPMFVIPGETKSAPSRKCDTQEDLLKALEQVFRNRKLLSEIESLIAQINDDKGEDEAL
jgi:hypothetical protein